MKDIYLDSFEAVTKRPKNMDYERYKALRRENNRDLKRRLLGVCVWAMTQMVYDHTKGHSIIKKTGRESYCQEKHGRLPRIVIS